MNHYQENLLAYFNEHRTTFIDWLAASQNDSIVVVNDLADQSVFFLRDAIRKEMECYDHRCRRYGLLIDMLIETHTAKGRNEPEFRGRLSTVARDFFVNGPAKS